MTCSSACLLGSDEAAKADEKAKDAAAEDIQGAVSGFLKKKRSSKAVLAPAAAPAASRHMQG